MVKDVAHYEEARLFDVPLPMGSRLVTAPRQNENLTDDAQTVTSWHSGSNVSETAEFYHRQMEQAGWLEVEHIVGSEHLFIFSKPDRMCVVTIRSRDRQTSGCIITLFCTQREKRALLK